MWFEDSGTVWRTIRPFLIKLEGCWSLKNRSFRLRSPTRSIDSSNCPIHLKNRLLRLCFLALLGILMCLFGKRLLQVQKLWTLFLDYCWLYFNRSRYWAISSPTKFDTVALFRVFGFTHLLIRINNIWCIFLRFELVNRHTCLPTWFFLLTLGQTVLAWVKLWWKFRAKWWSFLKVFVLNYYTKLLHRFSIEIKKIFYYIIPSGYNFYFS